MTTDEINKLRRRVRHFTAPFKSEELAVLYGDLVALLDDHARLAALVQSLAERCAKQSELLSQRAEKQSS